MVSSPLRRSVQFFPSMGFSLLIGVGLLVCGLTVSAHAQPAGDTGVYQEPGKKRVHVEGCRRLDADRSKYVTMTFAEAEAKGLALCSRCPGSTTAGRGNPGSQEAGNAGGGGLPESWVNPAPAEIARQEFVPRPSAPLVAMGGDGKLVSKPYSDKGDRLLDWSFVGYKMSEVPIPDVPVVEALEPLPAKEAPEGDMAYPSGPDSRKRIQEAMDKAGAREPDSDGIRGAVFLKKGPYFLSGPIRIPSGVVLRGEGDGPDGTVLIFSGGDSEGSAIEMGAAGVKAEPVGDVVGITNDYLPTGSTTLKLENAGAFRVGDAVVVTKTVNQKWIDDLGMGERLRHIRGGKEGAKKRPWRPEAYQLRIYREIAEVRGDEIVLDVMLPQSIAEEHGGGTVQKIDVGNLATQSGLESLRIVSNYDTTVKDTGKDANFKNWRNGVNVTSIRDAWVRDCSFLHFELAAVNTGEFSRALTVRDTQCIQPVGPKRGGNRYAFNVAGGTLHLFLNCYSEDGRHDFAGGSREQGPFAFVQCTAVRGGQSEPHHRWGTGFLYDGVTTKDGTLAAINRGDSGSGHGWAAANTLFWNGDAQNIVVMDPETEGENNFAIGFRGTYDASTGTDGLRYANDRAGYWGTPQEGKYYGYALMGSGHIESPNAPAEPGSLFTQQLIDRIGKEQAEAVLQ